jgi:phosphatidylglycerophosphate synthase
MKKTIFTVPNLLSLSRVVFLPLLYLFMVQDMKTAFLIGYILIGSTDFFDGKIARRFNQVSDIGKTLDSITDLFFYISSAYFMYVLFYDYLEPNMGLLIGFFGLLALSFVISTILLKKPILMHTSILRVNAVLVYLLIIASFFMDTTYFVSAILLTYGVGFIEEILIFIKFGEVDPDTPSIFALIKNQD